MTKRKVFICGAVLALLCTLGSAMAQQNEVSTNYDRFTDQTRISAPSKPIEITGLLAHGVDLSRLVHNMDISSNFTCPGKATACHPATVELVFTASTSRLEFPGSYGRLLIDGKAIDLGRGDWDGQIVSGDDLRERIAFNISPALLVRIGKAKHVDVQIGVFEFSLYTNPVEWYSPDNIGVLRELAQHIER